jgi:hypothetical protein
MTSIKGPIGQRQNSNEDTISFDSPSQVERRIHNNHQASQGKSKSKGCSKRSPLFENFLSL